MIVEQIYKCEHCSKIFTKMKSCLDHECVCGKKLKFFDKYLNLVNIEETKIENVNYIYIPDDNALLVLSSKFPSVISDYHFGAYSVRTYPLTLFRNSAYNNSWWDFTCYVNDVMEAMEKKTEVVRDED